MYLLDTSILLWAIEGNHRKLGQSLYNLIADENNTIYVSVISMWEVVIKSSLGKLKIPKDLTHQVRENNFIWLNVELPHILELEKLPLLHHDPFDRLLIAQSKATHLKLITSDASILKYKIECISN